MKVWGEHICTALVIRSVNEHVSSVSSDLGCWKSWQAITADLFRANFQEYYQIITGSYS